MSLLQPRRTPSASNARRKPPIFVVIGNPPYNAGQLNENDNNKNRKYPEIDARISETYAADSKATQQEQALRSLRQSLPLGHRPHRRREGIVCFVTNNGFVDRIAFDGMRKHLAQDFTRIYLLDLDGNVRKNPKLSGTTHNVFGIQVGVGITIARPTRKARQPRLHLLRVPDDSGAKEQKTDFLDDQSMQQALSGRS